MAAEPFDIAPDDPQPKPRMTIGLRGCRLVRAPLHAYAATCLPLLEAALPCALRTRFVAFKSRIDPRTVGQAR